MALNYYAPLGYLKPFPVSIPPLMAGILGLTLTCWAKESNNISILTYFNCLRVVYDMIIWPLLVAIYHINQWIWTKEISAVKAQSSQLVNFPISTVYCWFHQAIWMWVLLWNKNKEAYWAFFFFFWNNDMIRSHNHEVVTMSSCNCDGLLSTRFVMVGLCLKYDNFFQFL